MKTLHGTETRSALALLRQRLGLTQEALAIELGISRSFLALCEKKRRNLATVTLVKLSLMELTLNGNSNEMAGSILQEMASQLVQNPGSIQRVMNENERNALACRQFYNKEAGCRELASRWQADLEKMMARYQYLSECIGEVEKLMHAEKAGHSLTTFISGHLQKQYDNLEIKLAKCNLAAQGALRDKISLKLTAADLYAVNAGQLERDAD